MSVTVCLLAPTTLSYPEGGGHLWVGLNWALGLQELGCRVVWLEADTIAPAQLEAAVEALRSRLRPYGLDDRIALSPTTDGLSSPGCLEFEAALEADLLFNLNNSAPRELVKKFKRSALVDIDPGLLQIWASCGALDLAPHDVYFTIGETVGQPGAPFPDLGLDWNYTPPCVTLEWWTPHRAPDGAPFTTVAHWYASAWLKEEEEEPETKQDGFLPFLDLPGHTQQALELALDLEPGDPAGPMLEGRGWRVRDARQVASTPWGYQSYIQSSLGEFSCAKPSCTRLRNAWISDRTLCYLASGKPAVVQHTGPSRFLPDDGGLFRFRDVAEAVRCLERAVADYEHQSALARALAEEHFDTRKVVRKVLERALP